MSQFPLGIKYWGTLNLGKGDAMLLWGWKPTAVVRSLKASQLVAQVRGELLLLLLLLQKEEG